MGKIVTLRPGHGPIFDDNDLGRWIARKSLRGDDWVVADTWRPGDFCGWFKTEREAVAEARRRNYPCESCGEDDGF
jgi:hypothetical protein